MSCHTLSSALSKTPLSVGFILLPRFTLTAFASAIDVLRLAADDGDKSRQIKCRWDVLARDKTHVTSSCGIQIMPTGKLDDAAQYDYLAIIGGLLDSESRLSQQQADTISRCAKSKAKLIGVCTGSFELIELGMMKNRRCCVSWFHLDDLVSKFPDVTPVTDQLFVEDGRFITCAGGAGAAHLFAYLVARYSDLSDAENALRILHVEPHSTSIPAQPIQSDLFPTPLSRRLRRAVLLMETHVSTPLCVADLANRLGISRRQLERDFQTQLGLSPQKAGIIIRLQHARKLIAKSDITIMQAAQASGFTNAGNFSQRFKDLYGQSPKQFQMSQ